MSDPLPCPTEVRDGRILRDEEAPHRQVFCRNYDACLDVAVKSGWMDFSCERCPWFARTPTPSAVVYAHDRPKE